MKLNLVLLFMTLLLVSCATRNLPLNRDKDFVKSDTVSRQRDISNSLRYL